jgi:hypothetical protein
MTLNSSEFVAPPVLIRELEKRASIIPEGRNRTLFRQGEDPYLIWEQRVGGSNPSAPTIRINELTLWSALRLCRTSINFALSLKPTQNRCFSWNGSNSGETLWPSEQIPMVVSPTFGRTWTPPFCQEHHRC